MERGSEAALPRSVLHSGHRLAEYGQRGRANRLRGPYQAARARTRRGRREEKEVDAASGEEVSRGFFVSAR